MKDTIVYGLLLAGLLTATFPEPVYENTFSSFSSVPDDRLLPAGSNGSPTPPTPPPSECCDTGMQQRCPYDGDFRCKTSGRCIRASSVCDRYSNCPDGSDEQNCGTPNFGCYGYLCDNRTRCLSYSSVCNGRTSCLDESDEGYCLQRSCPYDGDFKCSDGRCLRASSVCNGYSSCDSGSDEENCDSKLCPYNGYFRCGTGECILSRYICDKYNNCRDGSDEINCTYNDECPYEGDIKCNSRCYRSYQFCDHYQRCISNTTTNCSTKSCPYDEDYRCPQSGICIRSYEICDGYSDCPNGEDEQNCTLLNCRYDGLWCRPYNRCLDHFYFYYFNCIYPYDCGYSCSYSCINSTQINYPILNCDGINDCADGSDESDCYSRSCMEANDFRCYNTGACIRQVKVCDGIAHCSDGSDETNCKSFSCPIPSDVKCNDTGVCIHYDKICDGKNDCKDGSDEENCAIRSCPYSDDRRCTNSQACIRASSWCNSYVDCMDGSDEESCHDIPCPYAGDFRCGYGHCTRGYYVCDGTEGCPDGSDEGMNYCPEVFNLGIHWERTLTNTTNVHKCSDIHPSFKLTDVITRECLRNRTWAPVNISQCVMSSDSPVVMIVIVSLDTNSTSMVKYKQDMIIQKVKEMIINEPVVNFETIQSVSSADVSVKITFEFDILTSIELIENIKYDKNLTELGNFSVTTSPQLTIFETADVCECPGTVNLSTVSTGENDTESIDVVSVCSGKPCSYNRDSNFTSNVSCAAPFVGDGKLCGKDSDGDGYPDMQLNCNDSHCMQDNCPTIFNPDQNLEACNDTRVANLDSSKETSDDEGLSVPTAVGITFVITLLLSVSITLLIVYIVYKIKKPTAKNVPSSVSAIAAGAPVPEMSTIKGAASSTYEDYEYPENNTRYQSDPSAVLQPNPAYSMEGFDKEEIYENIK